MVVGVYRGWFIVSHLTPDTKGDKVNTTITVDKGKVKSDVKKAEQKVKEEVKELGGDVKKEVK
jgi:hypothetical protein